MTSKTSSEARRAQRRAWYRQNADAERARKLGYYHEFRPYHLAVKKQRRDDPETAEIVRDQRRRGMVRYRARQREAVVTVVLEEHIKSPVRTVAARLAGKKPSPVHESKRGRAEKSDVVVVRAKRISYKRTGFRIIKQTKGAATVAQRMREGEDGGPIDEAATISQVLETARRFAGPA